MAFSQILVNGVIAGIAFGLLGLSFGVIYSTTQILHFAHGVVFAACAYVLFFLYQRWDVTLPVAAVATVVAGGGLGLVFYQALYRPFLVRRASGLVLMMASMVAFVLIENGIAIVFGNDSQVVSKWAVREGLTLAGIVVTPLQIASVAVIVPVGALTIAMLKWTRLGKALRAYAGDPFMAQVIGVNTVGLDRFVFAFGSALTAVAAIFVALDTGIRPDMGLSAVLIAMIAAIIGGLRSLWSGLLGGLLIGLAQNMSVVMLDPKWQNLITFSILLAFLVFRPMGLIGRRV